MHELYLLFSTKYMSHFKINIPLAHFWFDFKIICFYAVLLELSPLWQMKWYQFHSTATAGTKNKSIKKILILVDIFGRKKTPENNFIINRIFKSFVQIMGKIYFIFHWNLHERDPFFVCIKGKQLLWECAKTYFREKLEMYK